MIKKTLFGFLILVVSSSVVASFIILGSPGQERVRRMDDQRVQELQMISSSIDQYWSENHALPETLDEIVASRLYSAGSIRDPLTGEAYTYTPQEAGAYVLCASFDTAFEQGTVDYAPKVQFGNPNTFWNHPAGYYCFEITAKDWNSVTPVPIR